MGFTTIWCSQIKLKQTSHSIPKSNTQLIWGGQVRRFKPLPNLQSENILLWVKWPYLAVCSNLTSSVRFTLKDAHLSFPIPGDRKGQLVIAAAVFRDQLRGLVVTESLKHCILDQCRLLTMLCCYSHSLYMSLLEPDLDLWWKGLKLVESRAWELCGVLKACTIISSLPCSVKRASQINTSHFQFSLQRVSLKHDIIYSMQWVFRRRVNGKILCVLTENISDKLYIGQYTV